MKALKQSTAKRYEINPLTMAILPVENNGGKIQSLVIETESEYIVELAPTEIVELSCSFFGSSLKGRQEGTAAICQITHKAPISIAPSSGIYFYPTASPNNPQCSWISHTHVQNTQSAEHQCTEVVFVTGKSVVLDVSIGSMLNQQQRTAQYRFLLDGRIQSVSAQSAEY